MNMMAVIVMIPMRMMRPLDVMFAIDLGVAPQSLEHTGSEQTRDKRADERQEDDGG
jgi:hypothetical protein